MSYRKTLLIVLTILGLLGIVFFVLALEFPKNSSAIFVAGPSFYPELLSGLMVVLSVAGIVSTLRTKEEKTLEIQNIGRYFLVLGIILTWVFLWQRFGYFYVVAFVCDFALLYLFNAEPNSWKKLGKTLLINSIMVAVFYVIFNLLMKVRL